MSSAAEVKNIARSPFCITVLDISGIPRFQTGSTFQHHLNLEWVFENLKYRQPTFSKVLRSVPIQCLSSNRLCIESIELVIALFC